MTAPARAYDCAVIGAGVSGLCLAWRLAQTRADAVGSVVLIDGAARESSLHRTLSFWADAPTPYEPLVRHRWRALELVDDRGAAVPLVLERFEYRTLFLAELRRHVLGELARDPRFTVVHTRAHAVAHEADAAVIATDADPVRARWAFDSRLDRAALRVDTRRWHDARQHFRGWVVRASGPAFAGLRPRFMDFRAALAPGRAFFYVLPFAPDRALIELVSLDAGVDLAPELTRYVREVLGVEAYELLAEEAGVSPITDQPFATRLGPRVRAIGVAGGMLKPSTGYAFTRIVRDADAVAASLERHGHPFAQPRPRGVFRWMDGVLLEAWERAPARMPAVFRALFARNPADRVLAFLDERARAGAIVRMGLTLPASLFAGAAARWTLRRWFAPRARELGAGDHPRNELPPPRPE